MNPQNESNSEKNKQIWTKNAKFQQILGISKENCDKKTGQITSGDPIKSNFQKKNNEKVFTFGKYRGKTFDFVKTNDEHYWTWCCENVKDFNR